MTATKFFLTHQGMKGTQKQIEKLEKQFDKETILRMARARGYSETNQ